MPKPVEEIDLESEEEEEEDEEPEAPKPPVVQAAPLRRPPKRGKGIASPPQLPREVELLWPMLIDDLLKQGQSPYAVRIQVLQIDPPMGNAGDQVSLGAFSGGSVAGTPDLPAGLALLNYVTDNFHMPRPQSRGPVRYQLRFLWAQNSQNFARGELTLPPREEIIALRNAERATRQAQGEPVQPYSPPPVGYGQSPHQQQPMQLPPSFYPPQPDNMPAMLGMMQEMWRASLEGRQPQMPPNGFAAPPPPPVSEDAIVAKVLAALEKTGMLRPAGVAAPMPAQPPPTPAIPPASMATPASAAQSMMDKAFNRIIESAVASFTGGIEKSVKTAISGVGAGAPPEEEEEEEPAPKDAFDVPFKVANVPEARWPDGTPVNYAADSKTGDISPIGLAMSNPYVAGRAMDAANGLAGALTDLLKNIGKSGAASVGAGATPRTLPPNSQPPPAEIVSEIPAGAIDATPNGDWRNG